MNSEYFTKRFEAVFLHLHPRGPKLSIAATARQIKKSKAFVRKWVEQYKREKNVNDQPNVHPNLATTPEQDRRIVQLFEQNRGMSVGQGRQRLSRRGFHASTSTIQRRLHAVSLAYRSTIKKPLLSPIHIEKRMHWANENITTDWSKVIYTD